MRERALRACACFEVDDLGKRELHRLAVGVAGLERGEVAAEERRLLGEAPLDPGDRRVGRLAAEPERQAERPEILGAASVLAAEPERGDGFERALRHRDRDRAVGRGAAVVDRVAGEPGLHVGALVEGALVVDDGAAGLQELDVGDEGGRVEGDEHVGLVARRQHLAGAELHLVGGDAEGGAGRRADLGRKLRQRHQVGAVRRGGGGELVAGKLHAVAGIAGEAHDEASAGAVLRAARGARRLSFGGVTEAHGFVAASGCSHSSGSGWICVSRSPATGGGYHGTPMFGQTRRTFVNPRRPAQGDAFLGNSLI